MSNTETDPKERTCENRSYSLEDLGSGITVAGNGIQLLEPRDVPLGGPRAMTVRRTLPQRARSLVGAWCFLDTLTGARSRSSATSLQTSRGRYRLHRCRW